MKKCLLWVAAVLLMICYAAGALASPLIAVTNPEALEDTIGIQGERWCGWA